VATVCGTKVNTAPAAATKVTNPKIVADEPTPEVPNHPDQDNVVLTPPYVYVKLNIARMSTVDVVCALRKKSTRYWPGVLKVIVSAVNTMSALVVVTPLVKRLVAILPEGTFGTKNALGPNAVAVWGLANSTSYSTVSSPKVLPPVPTVLNTPHRNRPVSYNLMSVPVGLGVLTSGEV